MPAIRDFAGQPLQWRLQRFFSRTYELRAGQQILATISRSGFLNVQTNAETEGQQWVFKRSKSTRKQTEIYARNPQSQDEMANPLALFNRGWKKTGELIFSDGRSYAWTSTGSWRPTWLWTDANNLPLLSFNRRKTLEIAPAASNSPDLVLLTLFGVHRMIIMAEEEAAAASAG